MTGSPAVTPPSRSDGFVALVVRRLGGPIGRHAGLPLGRLTATNLAILTACVVWALGALQKLPCRVPLVGNVDWFARMCYSDIPVLYTDRGLATGNIPYFDTGNYPVLEYPVLTGYLLEMERRITALLGFGPTTDQGAQLTASYVFFDVNVVVLFVLLLITVVAHARLVPGRGHDAMMLAASPLLVLTGLINWDLLPVALTAVGCLLWARRRPTWAGVLLGLGMAAKLYPLFLLGPLLVLCLRSGRMAAFGRTVAGFAVAWLVVDLPVIIAAPGGFLGFWTFNQTRGADLGSFWYVLQLAGSPVPDLDVVSLGLFLLGCAAIGLLALLAPRRPRFGQLAYLVIVVFLITNKVYSPQYQLWLLPLMIMARPRWRDWWIFTAGEAIYVIGIWGYLSGWITPGSGGTAPLYWLTVIIRIITELVIAGLVVRDILVPRHDPVRADGGPGCDDPAGGVLDGAPDRGWLRRWRASLGFAVPPDPAWPSPSGRPQPGARSAVVGSGAPPAAGATTAIPAAPGPAATVRPAVRIGDGGRLVVQGWLASRGLIIIVAAVVGLVSGRGLGSMVNNWDAALYQQLARQGYRTGSDETLMAFFPGLPAALRAGLEIGLPTQVTGMILSAVGSALAAAALLRLARGPWAALLWLFAPTAVFTVVPYTESLFCAAAFWAWERARAGRWLWAGVLAMLACTVRVSGVFLLGALAVMIITTRVEGRAGWRQALARSAQLPWLLPGVAVVLAFAVFLHALTGSWTAWYHAQATGWARQLTWPWQSAINTWQIVKPGAYPDHPDWPPMFRCEVVSMIIGLITTGWCLGRRRWAEASWVGVQVLAFSLSYWFFSVNRAVLLWFPSWIMLAELARHRPASAAGRTVWRIGVGVAVVIMVGFMIWWCREFFTGRWAS